MYRLIVFILIILPFCCFSQEQDTIRIVLKEKVAIAKTSSEKLDAYLALGEYELDHDFSKARTIITKALQLTQEKNEAISTTQQGLVYVQLGVLNRRLGDHSKALEYYLEALKLFKADGDEKNEADIYHNIGMIYVFQKQYKKSRDYFFKSITLNKKIENTFGVAQATQMLGGTYKKVKELDSALFYFNSSKSIFIALGKEEQLQSVNNNLVATYRKLRAYDKALQLSLKNINYSKTEGKLLALCGNYYATALIYEKLKDYRTAGKYADSSLNIAKKEGFTHRIASAYKKRSQLWNKFENYKMAYRDYKRYKTYSDSVFNTEIATKIQELELQYEFEKQQQEIELVAKSERSKKWLYFILFITTLIAAVIIALLVKRNYKNKIELAQVKHTIEKQSLNEKIENKEANVKQLIADNTMRLTFKKEMLDRIKIDSNTENAERLLQKLKNDLRLQIESEGKLSGLQEKIAIVNQSFDNTLKINFPELTKGEREVVALLRLKLSIKEIMTIRNVSVDSVKSMRRRIRKKMAIPKTQSIEDFIQNLI